MTFNKKIREQVYTKYDGRCAYCGREIKLGEMQIDHIHPRYLDGTDDFDNLNPSCRMCNFRKATLTVEKFREEVRLQAERMFRTFPAKMSLAYGLIDRIDKPIVFYFEREESRYG